MRISDLYNMDIYTDSGQFLGEVKDATVDLERGEVSRLLMVEWKAAGRESATKVLQQKSILFRNIRNIGDVVVVAATGQTKKAEDVPSSSEASELSRY
jgi:sporulation protein YlmC with PRC-barrel domain